MIVFLDLCCSPGGGERETPFLRDFFDQRHEQISWRQSKFHVSNFQFSCRALLMEAARSILFLKAKSHLDVKPS